MIKQLEHTLQANQELLIKEQKELSRVKSLTYSFAETHTERSLVMKPGKKNGKQAGSHSNKLIPLTRNEPLSAINSPNVAHLALDQITSQFKLNSSPNLSSSSQPAFESTQDPLFADNFFYNLNHHDSHSDNRNGSISQSIKDKHRHPLKAVEANVIVPSSSMMRATSYATERLSSSPHYHRLERFNTPTSASTNLFESSSEGLDLERYSSGASRILHLKQRFRTQLHTSYMSPHAFPWDDEPLNGSSHAPDKMHPNHFNDSSSFGLLPTQGESSSIHVALLPSSPLPLTRPGSSRPPTVGLDISKKPVVPISGEERRALTVAYVTSGDPESHAKQKQSSFRLRVVE